MANEPPLPPRKSSARDYLLINLLGVPGVGSFLAGQRVSGAIQTLLSLGGFTLTMFWAGSFIATWWHTREFPFDGGPRFGWGILGVAVFGAGWIWGLVTGLKLKRQAHETDPRA